MTPTIVIAQKTVYGRILLYPHCEMAKKFAALLNVKTFSHANLCGIEALGYIIETAKLPA